MVKYKHIILCQFTEEMHPHHTGMKGNTNGTSDKQFCGLRLMKDSEVGGPMGQSVNSVQAEGHPHKLPVSQ